MSEQIARRSDRMVGLTGTDQKNFRRQKAQFSYCTNFNPASTQPCRNCVPYTIKCLIDDIFPTTHDPRWALFASVLGTIVPPFLMISTLPGRPSPSIGSEPTDYLNVPVDVVAPGFVFLVDSDTMTPIELVLRYLVHCATRFGNKTRTIRTKCDHLYDFLTYLHTVNVAIEQIHEDIILDYRNNINSIISNRTGQSLETTTVRGRLITVRSFYDWFIEGHWGTETRRQLRPRVVRLVRPIAGGLYSPQDSVVPRAKQHLVEWIDRKDQKAIFAQLGSDPLEKDDTRSSRDWLISLVGLTTGMRRLEILGLTWQQIQAINIDDSQSNTTTLILRVTKYGKPRAIAIPIAVVRRLLAYIDAERKDIVRRATRAGIAYREPSALFLNGPSCRSSLLGKPYQEKRLDEAFAAAQIAAGVTRVVEKLDKRTGKLKTVIVPKHRFHHERHTYAIEAYIAYAHLPEADRWMRIQQQLGHASHLTTANIYCRAVGARESEARDTTSRFLKSLADG